jgi:trimethylamine:corrinoid methyltransferase-like protein
MVGFEKHGLMPSFRVFTQDALDAIHSASLEVLEKLVSEFITVKVF